MGANFVSKSTSTANKELFETQFEQHVWKNYCKVHPHSHAITLVGAIDGFERHRDKFLDIGIADKHIIIVEQEIATFIALRDYAKTHGYQCQIVLGDFHDVLKNNLNKGIHFSVVDFDGTDSLNSEYHLPLLKTIKRYSKQIEGGMINAALRTKSIDITPPEFVTLINDYTNYHALYQSYWGISGMGVYFFTKKPIHLKDTGKPDRDLAYELHSTVGLNCVQIATALTKKGHPISYKSVSLWFQQARAVQFA